MKVFAVSCLAAVALLPQFASAAGNTIEDACAGLSENDACSVLSPLQYEAFGTCQWTSTGTEAPYVTEPPNPANVACASLSSGDSCLFLDPQINLPVTGTCRQSTVVGYDGLQCEVSGDSETEEEAVCEGAELHDACTMLKADGLQISGTCEDSGSTALRCEQSDDPGTGSGGDNPGSTGDLDIRTMDPSEIACLQNSTDVSYGWLNPGDACSFEQNDNKTQNGTCVSKSGGAYFACESTDIGGGGGGDDTQGGGAEVNPELTACNGLASDDACTIVDPLSNDTLDGTCHTSPQGDLFCQPGRRRLSLYLICDLTSGGGEVTNTPKATQKDLGNSDAPVTFENTAGAVVGGVIGGLVGAALIVVGGIFLHRKYGKRRLDVDLDTEGGDVYQTL